MNDTGNLRRRAIHIEETHLGQRLRQQQQRIRRIQRRWKKIKEDLPPQLSRRHIGMISIGGVIGTGLFLGSADAIYHGGPVGALIAYGIIGSVVYCLCVSIGEMIAFLPNVGGVVGLADLYVDKALGFSLGWAAWYNWSVTLPAEITAAAILVSFWDEQQKIPVAAWSAIFLICATAINCFSSRLYGEFEFWFSTIKVLTIVVIIITSLLIDLGAAYHHTHGPIGFRYWHEPGPFAQYFDIPGATGRFLGFWAVLMQASFSFFGSEVPGIAAGEVIDATRNVPRALQRVWIRIVLFYVGGMLCAGLLVPHDNPKLQRTDDNGYRSPFVIAIQSAGIKLPSILNAAFLLSAWSAAASDVYISSRFLFFLARCHHAPQFLAFLVRHPHYPLNDPEDTSDDDSDDELLLSNSDQSFTTAAPTTDAFVDVESVPSVQPKPYLVVPYAAVICSASVGLLSFLGIMKGNGPQAFGWLVAVASVASLQSWAGLLFTYIRWHQGTVYAEKKHKDHPSTESSVILSQIDKIKEHRHSGQPYLAWYAFTVCMLVLITNGSAVFLHQQWRIAETSDDDQSQSSSSPSGYSQSDPISNFLSSYIPIPFFILLTFGYKLIHKTKLVRLDEMTFSREVVPEKVEDELEPRNIWERITKLII
ncbi:amino acid permease-domain-containing protein [Amylocystis lapponica]|nr:amino acid permease-domain-containing protein [Amylocystis lapponica]